ncbi:MAG: SRPBCC domain-containing protein [Terracidiphilus sp.]|jgi:uncharacterized protein YndB with AHSA1/START domain
MKAATDTIELTFERTIPASPTQVFEGWLSPKVSGTPWNIAEKLSLDPKIDGFFYLHVKGISHYGRFTEVESPSRIRHTWVSPNTLGLESIVTLTFKKQGADTIMTLAHSGLPDTPEGRKHEQGWNYFLNTFPEQFGKASREEK